MHKTLWEKVIKRYEEWSRVGVMIKLRCQAKLSHVTLRGPLSCASFFGYCFRRILKLLQSGLMDASKWKAYNKFINNPIFYKIIEEEKKLAWKCSNHEQHVINKKVFRNLLTAENTQSSALTHQSCKEDSWIHSHGLGRHFTQFQGTLIQANHVRNSGEGCCNSLRCETNGRHTLKTMTVGKQFRNFIDNYGRLVMMAC
ncbi:hypothetical protein EAF04_007760 [Stromatinia cepivora]|nr:hypothetical protein EAF04_007760 [Stromatinia cepivora]